MEGVCPALARLPLPVESGCGLSKIWVGCRRWMWTIPYRCFSENLGNLGPLPWVSPGIPATPKAARRTKAKMDLCTPRRIAPLPLVRPYHPERSGGSHQNVPVILSGDSPVQSVRVAAMRSVTVRPETGNPTPYPNRPAAATAPVTSHRPAPVRPVAGGILIEAHELSQKETKTGCRSATNASLPPVSVLCVGAQQKAYMTVYFKEPISAVKSSAQSRPGGRP